MKKEPWSPADATGYIRRIALRSIESGQVIFTRHASSRMQERSLLMGDVLYVLKHGFVYDDPEPCKRMPNCFRYAIESTSPNSDNRTVRVIVIPDAENGNNIKIVTVMWKDEK